MYAIRKGKAKKNCKSNRACKMYFLLLLHTQSGNPRRLPTRKWRENWKKCSQIWKELENKVVLEGDRKDNFLFPPSRLKIIGTSSWRGSPKHSSYKFIESLKCFLRRKGLGFISVLVRSFLKLLGKAAIIECKIAFKFKKEGRLSRQMGCSVHLKKITWIQLWCISFLMSFAFFFFFVQLLWMRRGRAKK